MENFMRARVQARLDALGLNPFEAARAAGLNRYIVFDLIEGKKSTIRHKAVVQLAQALDCDPEYLIGAQKYPKATPEGEAPAAAEGMPLAGICEEGAWRTPDAATQPQRLPIAPDPRYPAEAQAAYLMRGDAGEPLGIRDGDVIVAVADTAFRDGDMIIARRSRQGGEIETTARIVRGDQLAGASDVFPPFPISKAKRLGRVIAIHRVL